jgi:poly-gamma-glutamate synthesis protein (capsule biosynthesis protein)
MNGQMSQAGELFIMIQVVRIFLFVLIFLGYNLPIKCQVKFSAVGDVLLDRGVRKSIESNNIYFPFEKIAEQIKSNDINFFNLETPIAKESDGYRINKRFSFRSDPDVIAGLKFAGFNIAAVANNHTIDFGKSGFLKTMTYLKNDSITPVGGGANQNEAFSPVIITKNGEKFAFFGFLEFLLEGVVFNDFQPYPAFGDLDRLCNEIRKIRKDVTYVIVSFHWGQEGAAIPTSKQIEIAHEVIDAGADLILGHHPHVLQSIESYKGKLIFYSLGNFIFDNVDKLQNETVIFKCVFKKGKLLNPHLIPVKIKNTQPQLADSLSRIDIFNHLTKVSKYFNTSLIMSENIIKINPANDFKKEINIADYKVSISESEISIIDSNRQEYKRILPDSNYSIIDAKLWKKDSSLLIYSIIKNKVDSLTQLAVFPFLIFNKKFAQPSIDIHKHYNAWKIEVSDLDNDSLPELIVGVIKPTRYYSNIEKRIFVFNAEDDYIYPKWLGSKIGDEVLDFSVTRDNKILIVHKLKNEAAYTLSSYKWNGFGFDLEGVLDRSSKSDAFRLTDFK